MTRAISRRTFLATATIVSLQGKRGFAQESTSNSERVGSMMTQADKLANATVRMVLANGRGEGSGFHFIKPEIIVSNAHVMTQLISGQSAMTAHAETGESWALKVLAYSPPDKFDFAIMEASGAGVSSRVALSPSTNKIIGRGLKLLYSGYPHGIDPLLVNSSEVASPMKDNTFVFSGMVHGGNSGGPVVSNDDLSALGIVTKRRFFGDPEMRAVDAEMKELQDYLGQISARGKVEIMGVNFGQFALAMSRIASLTNEIIRVNSTTGIGIANSISPLVEKCKELKLL